MAQVLLTAMALIALVLNRSPRTATGMVLAMAFFAVALGTLSTRAQQSTNPAGNQGRQISLREQLTTGLKATTKADFAFIDKVVLLVDQGRLPQRLVDSTFLWSRERAIRRSPMRSLRPMVYFRPAMVARAQRIGVEL